MSDRLSKHGISVRKVSVELGRHPDRVEYHSLEAAYDDVKRNGTTEYYDIRIYGNLAEKDIELSIFRATRFDGVPFHTLKVNGAADSGILNDVANFLGLEPEEPFVPQKLPERTAFIAHRFDNQGIAISDKVARFFELLNFQVVSGRSYTPGSVSEKVRRRIERQAIIVVIITQGEDNTWLTQESFLGHLNSKPLFILKEQGASFKSALLSDHEYIPFEIDRIEMTFIPILQGLRELNYLQQDKKEA